MKFKKKLKIMSKEALWEDYCGFMDLNIRDYMYIQNRLFEEQFRLFSASGLGKKLMKDRTYQNAAEFLSSFPFTRYEDYAEILLSKRGNMLPGEPVIWIETTWEGGFRPTKLAPYTRAMLDTYKHNVLSIMMLSSGREKGEFTLTGHDRILYGGAPLPYATGLLPSLLAEEADFEWLPDTNENSALSFGERIRKGFKMGLHGGIDYFFAIGSVANYITEHFGDTGGKAGSLFLSPDILIRYMKAKSRHRRDGGRILPGEIFRLKGFMATGTDAACYKDRLEKAWGIRPIEIAAGTESTCLATDNYEHRGMVFFPDACFYEFIPENELFRERTEPDYVPRTCLMDGVTGGEIYELVISVLHGGAFMRYRIGDLYRCVSGPAGDALPRFTFLDRTEDVIDIAGFTRITEASVNEVIRESGLPIQDWIAKKEFGQDNAPFLHLYVEYTNDRVLSDAMAGSMLTDHLALYFKHFDSDYNDLKKLLNMEPLKLTILKTGTIQAAEKRLGRKIRAINPSAMDLNELTDFRKPIIPPVLQREEDT